MNYIFMVIFCVALALFLFLSLIAYLITSGSSKKISKKDKNIPTAKPKKAKKVFDTNLDNMIAAAADPNLSDSDLQELVKIYVATHKLGSKTSKELDEATKKKLEFVASLASNINASPQTVSFLNKELKKISASYKKEIDAYEQMGLAKRKIKEEQ
ncbi:hypothetical protein ACD575_00625 [Campylobacter sp. LH-2024]|uniref:hypothetical protein n=1 Tax=Campylobacter TaxID=194 RepID=UPI00190685C1|nr:hypothetical protein [Campylobacter sp. 2018MI35]MBZ7930786.1 hypothetical protein [Campylobacter sp. RM12910]MBZ7933388.1 hypothetical protein [Campylobacter sp. RM10543]MBZ7941230.1 hypothetical protein [Campylobacter sp. W0047]MBZ7941577.1 hypothetical protein [Campylobacter sp. W0045]MBZ7944239.1 hypothetical protein [Campylobacter sp. RM13744]MBZ7945221.1 hypothetical protein [Campylobacter sp. RM10532]MBZ7947098.1 hypothetical protein [Campylobacter sp. RM10536]MBZ7948620.1 hypothe